MRWAYQLAILAIGLLSALPLSLALAEDQAQKPPPSLSHCGGTGTCHIVAIDPGHGGPESGAVAGDLVERDVNLRVALDLAQLLAEDGIGVVLTRSGPRAVNPDYLHAPDRPQARRDLQMRIDIANQAGADLYLSIHNNGSPNPAEHGTEIWYDGSRPFADRNVALAQLALDSVVQRLRAAGYDGASRGLREDSHFRVFRDRAFPLFVLGPGTTGFRPYIPTAMPGIVGETLFLTNASDAAALHQPAALRAIAAGYEDAVVRYFQQFG